MSRSYLSAYSYFARRKSVVGLRLIAAADPGGARCALRDAIERIVLEFPGYGYRRVTAELHRRQWTVNHKRVLRIMRAESLLC